jgi:hypothetical protein
VGKEEALCHSIKLRSCYTPYLASDVFFHLSETHSHTSQLNEGLQQKFCLYKTSTKPHFFSSELPRTFSTLLKMHAVDTEKGKPVVVKSEKEVLDIASGIVQQNGLEEYEDVIKRGALLANVRSIIPFSFQTLLSTMCLIDKKTCFYLGSRQLGRSD